MIPRPKYIANKMPRHIIIFLLLIIYINVICIHQVYADGISMTSRNIHMNSIVENKNDFNRLKAEEINTKAMEMCKFFGNIIYRYTNYCIAKSN